MAHWNTPMKIDGTDNAARAARVLQAIYPAYDDDTAEAAVRDVMNDLRHLCDLMGWNYAVLDRQAHTGYMLDIQEAGGIADNAELKASIEKELM